MYKSTIKKILLISALGFSLHANANTAADPIIYVQCSEFDCRRLIPVTDFSCNGVMNMSLATVSTAQISFNYGDTVCDNLYLTISETGDECALKNITFNYDNLPPVITVGSVEAPADGYNHFKCMISNNGTSAPTLMIHSGTAN
jgi:hypothetical protein